MTIHYPELLGPAIVSFVAVIFVAPWHIRMGNIATISMVFWMTALNFVHIVNSALWNVGADNKAPVWCDISATLQVGYNYGLPLSHLLLARQLEALTTLRQRSVLFDQKLKKRKMIVDVLLAGVSPIVGILLHLSQMDRRFYILEGVGCVPATYWDTYGLIAMALVPVGIALAAGTYTIMALVNIWLRRQKMMSMIASGASVNKDQFLRLFVLALAEYGTCFIRAMFNMTAWTKGPQPLGQGLAPTHSLTLVETVTKDQITFGIWKVQLLQWYTVTACSCVFFLCFVTGTELVHFYQRIAHKVFPCIPEPRTGMMQSLHSSGFTSSQSGNRGLESKPRDMSISSKSSQIPLQTGGVCVTTESSTEGDYALSDLPNPLSPMSPIDEDLETPTTATHLIGHTPNRGPVKTMAWDHDFEIGNVEEKGGKDGHHDH